MSLTEKIGKYFVFGLIGVIIVAGRLLYIRGEESEKKIAELHNQLAAQAETIEVQKDVYSKATLELEDLKDVLKASARDGGNDGEVIKRLLKELDQRDADYLAVSRIAVKWKKAYEAKVPGRQEEVPGEKPEDPVRTKVSFDKDFGYIGVNGWTLTDPAEAFVSVKQNRPLLLTMAVTQEKDGSWKTNVGSSEENVEIDVKLSAVNPFLFKEKWYERFSLDVGFDASSAGIYPYLGTSYTFKNGLSIGAGVWGSDTSNFGPYGSIGYSWAPFSRK